MWFDLSIIMIYEESDIPTNKQCLESGFSGFYRRLVCLKIFYYLQPHVFLMHCALTLQYKAIQPL